MAYSKETAAGVRILGVYRSGTDVGATANSLTDNFDVEVLALDDLVEKVANFEEYKRSIQLEFKEKRLPDASFAIADILAPTRVQIGLSATPKIGVTGPGRVRPLKVGYDRVFEEFRDVSEIEKEAPPTFDFDEIIFKWLRDETSARQIALLGDYGQGKSTAVLALTHKLLFDPVLRKECKQRFPILIRLTGRSPSSTRLSELLGAWGAQYNLSGQALLALHRAGRLLLIFDAFDEMAHVMDRTARFEHFDALWEFASGGAKLLFTGRPNFFLDDEELKEVLGIAKRTAVGPYCEAVKVVPFGISQIETAVSWLPENKRVALVQAIKDSAALNEVCCRPSLLYLIAHLWARDRLDLKKAQVNSAQIIQEFISFSLERQVQKQT